MYAGFLNLNVCILLRSSADATHQETGRFDWLPGGLFFARATNNFGPISNAPSGEVVIGVERHLGSEYAHHRTCCISYGRYYWHGVDRDS